MKHIKIFYILAATLLLAACREKDRVTYAEIGGRVINNCNDSGLANIRVYLNTYKGQRLYSTRESESDNDGSFLFSNTQIHHNDEYSYILRIPGKSGDGASSPENSGFVGASFKFSKTDAGSPKTLRVTPCIFRCCLTVQPPVAFNGNDSLRLVAEQPLYHHNVPDLPASIVKTQEELSGGITNCTWANYPMGLWRITVHKWKSGSYSVFRDSVYLSYKADQTYTIHW